MCVPPPIDYGAMLAAQRTALVAAHERAKAAAPTKPRNVMERLAEWKQRRGKKGAVS